MDLVTAEQMRQIERYVIEEIGIPGIILMENAGKSVADEIVCRFPKPQKAIILSGKGNNGGDGWVIARHLLFKGWQVSAWLIGKEEEMSPDAKLHYEVLKHFCTIHRFEEGKEDQICTDLKDSAVVVDALLGTGAKGALRDPILHVVKWVNQVSSSFVVAVDLPTGVNSDTGEVQSEAIQADLTVALHAPKWGHYLRPGAEMCGELVVAPIGLPPKLDKLAPPNKVNHPTLWQEALKPRTKWSHKGTYGHLLLVGGAQGMLGAIKMAGEAAYRMGCGMVTCAVPKSERLALSAGIYQELAWGWPGDESFDPDSWRYFLERKKKFSCVAIGPGLGRFQGEEKWLKQLIEQIDVPIVLDADALNILSAYPGYFKKNQTNRSMVITPHPKEMARLAQTTVEEVERNRREIALKFAQQWNVIVVLKGKYTLIAFPDGKLVINPTGNAVLAKAGSGDILTGMIGSLLAQRLSPSAAVLMGVYIHGKLGEVWQGMEQTAVASDLLSHIDTVLKQIHMEFAP